MKLKYAIVILILLVSFICVSSCRVGSGCPADKAETAKFNKRGNLKGGGGKTKLLPNTRR